MAQPASTKTGVGYMQNGEAQILQNPSTDHALASRGCVFLLGTSPLELPNL